MILRLGFLVLAASAAAAFSHHNHHSSIKQLPPEKDGSSLQNTEEEEKFEDELSEGEAEIEKSKKLSSRNCGETEFSNLDKNSKNANKAYLSRTAGKELETKKLALEKRLNELNGLKKCWSSISHLKKNLKEKMQKIQMLNLTIDSLKAEMNDIEKKLKEGILAANQLEKAKRMMRKMKRELDANGNNLKSQLLILQNQVSGFQNSEPSHTDSLVEQKLKVVEMELLKLKRENKELQLGKREVVVKLVSTQARITALSNMTEQNEVIGQIKDEISTLKDSNEELSKDVETLQRNRFAMVEELVYQRWLNTCLRFEIQDHKTPSRKASNRDAKTDSRPRLDLSLGSTSSHSSSTDSSNDNYSSSMMSSSSSSQRSIPKKSSFIHRLKKWGTNKDEYSAVESPDRSSYKGTSGRNGLIRRFSTSMVPTKPSIANFPPKENLNPSRRTRRVSFNDAVRIVAPIRHEHVSESAAVMDTDGPSHISLLNVNVTLNSKPGKAEDEHGLTLSPLQNSDGAEVGSGLNVKEKEGNKDNNLGAKMNKRNENAVSNLEELHSESTNVQHGDGKADIHMVHVVVVLFLLFMWFAIFLQRIF